MTDTNLPEAKSLGDLTPSEIQRLTALRQQSEGVIHQIGLNRVRENRLMDQLRWAEQEAQTTLSQVGVRLGIAEGTPWSVTAEGQAVLVELSPVPKT